MTRWAMVADLQRCVGCQTCTAACKHANATSPAVQWRWVLDIETGEYPSVKRTFVPVGCMHCADPPCMHVCPSTATKRRDDGIVTIDYELCIGCSYCAVACPYQARYKVDKPVFAYGQNRQMKNEAQREDPARLGVAQKCTFCVDRIDFGLENGLTPGVDPDATPVCVNSCIASALHFGDLDDAGSNVSKLLEENESFRMHDDMQTDSGFHYVWGTRRQDVANPSPTGDDGDRAMAAFSRGTGEIGGAAPWLQQHWDWRAAGNFMCGGAGAGMLAVVAVAALAGLPAAAMALAALGLIAVGLLLVGLETGRPFRAPLNVFYHPQTSWMTREAMVAIVLFPLTLAAVWLASTALLLAAAAAALGFLYCQARMLKAAKGIPAWRQPEIVPLVVATGLAEGAGLVLATGMIPGVLSAGEGGAALATLVLIAVRAWAWAAYRGALAKGAPIGTTEMLARINPSVLILGHLAPAILIAIALALPAGGPGIAAGAGLLTILGGWLTKFVIVTRAAYNQGFAIERTPARGSGGGGPGAKPGWSGI